MKRVLGFIVGVVGLLVILNACGGGGDTTPTPVDNTIGDTQEENKTNETPIVSDDENKSEELISFHFKNAKLLVSYNEPFLANSSEVSRINLKSVDDNGIREDAISSKYPIKVLYTVTNPKGDAVFVALDANYDTPNDDLDYRAFFKESKCALYEVNITDNSFECVKEGLILKKMDEAYLKMMSSDTKAISFDTEGNAYFLASSFEVESNGLKYNNSEKLYQYSVSDKSIKELSNDSEELAYFTVLADGSIVYKSSANSVGVASLNFIANDNKIDIEESLNIDYFTTDNYNSVIYGTYEYQAGKGGIKFARKLANGSVNKATLDTTDLGGQPQRIYIADDGNMYGLFQESKYIDSIGKFDNRAYLYQLLPRETNPKAEIILGTKDYYSYVGNTPLQISKGYLYYSEVVNVSFDGQGTLGSANIIHIIRLSNQEKITLLEPKSVSDDRIEIYQWRLRDKKIFFSGVNKKGNNLVTGVIDTQKVSEGATQSEYLTLTESVSAVESAQEIEDIEIVLPSVPEKDTGGVPSSTKVSLDAQNRYSASIEFSKYMNKESVIGNLSFTDESNDIPVLPLWIYKTLHLIPDLDYDLGNDITKTLEENQTYTLDFAEGVEDLYEWNYVGDSKTVTMDYTAPKLKLYTELSDYQNRASDREFIALNRPYNDQGAYSVDEDLEVNILSSDINISQEGNYSVIYEAKDSAGNQGIVTRKITVAPLPFITLTDDGATAEDGYGNDITAEISIFDESSFNYSGGDYNITYEVKNSLGYTFSITRSITRHVIVN